MSKAQAMQEYGFDDREEFLDKLERLVKEGTDPKRISTLTPYHVHQVEHILKTRPSPMRFVTLAGALAGLILSLGFIIFTVLDWPLIVGGKPLISIPAFVVVAFECTILVGGIVSFLGFLHLTRLPNLKRIVFPDTCREGGNRFHILVQTGGDRGVNP